LHKFLNHSLEALNGEQSSKRHLSNMCRLYLPLYLLLIALNLVKAQPQQEQVPPQQQSSSTKTPPNVLVFIVDDMGWNQVGYHAKPSGNDEIRTPNIDHYATKVGIELDRGYMTPWCGPSRAAIMTGRTNVYNFNVSSLISTFDDDIGYVAGLQPGTRTLATALKEYGRSINVPYTAWFNGKFGIGVRQSLPVAFIVCDATF
jgi:Sulfatase